MAGDSFVCHVPPADCPASETAPPLLRQSKQVLTRPYCILELVTAIDAGVPIVGVFLAGCGGKAYDFADAAQLLENLDSALEHITPGAEKLLTDHGVDLADAAYVGRIPGRRSTPVAHSRIAAWPEPRMGRFAPCRDWVVTPQTPLVRPFVPCFGAVRLHVTLLSCSDFSATARGGGSRGSTARVPKPE